MALPLQGIRVLDQLHATPGAIRLAPSTLGQHTEEVLAELGYSAAEIAALYTTGAITPRLPQAVS